jgi:hypothetical protein
MGDPAGISKIAFVLAGKGYTIAGTTDEEVSVLDPIRDCSSPPRIVGHNQVKIRNWVEAYDFIIERS